MTGDARVVAFVGRLVPQKAPGLALDVFERIQHDRPDTRLVLIGDGPEAPAIDAALQSRGLAGRVTWLRGAIGGDILPAVDVLLVTSHYEGFPYVMLEALDAGCAIVSTAVGGARDCIIPGRNGEIMALPTADALASTVNAFIDSPARLRDAHDVSRERARSFEIGRMVDRLVTLYREDAHAA
jgi:glycosyltransferase involved in cell wall biosynthesis